MVMTASVLPARKRRPHPPPSEEENGWMESRSRDAVVVVDVDDDGDREARTGGNNREELLLEATERTEIVAVVGSESDGPAAATAATTTATARTGGDGRRRNRSRRIPCLPSKGKKIKKRRELMSIVLVVVCVVSVAAWTVMKPTSWGHGDDVINKVGEIGRHRNSISTSLRDTTTRILTNDAPSMSFVSMPPQRDSIQHGRKFAHRRNEEADEEGKEKEKEKEEEEGYAASRKDATAVIGIVMVLIVLTLVFEICKEGIEEQAVSEDARLVIEKLFGELTVLGFLAMVTYVIGKTGLVELIAVHVMHYEDQNELLEYMESVHYTIFCVMILFVVQVLVLVREAKETDDKWLRMELYCRAQDEERQQQQQQHPGSGRRDRVMMFLRQSTFDEGDGDEEEDTLAYQALRKEFILERNIDPPFHPKPDEKRLSDDEFNFGRYLALAQSHILMHVVEVQHITWYSFFVAAILFYVLSILVNQNLVILGWIWVGIMWSVLLVNVLFERHLIEVRKQFLPKRVVSMLYGGGNGGGTSAPESVVLASENAALLLESHGGDDDDRDQDGVEDRFQLPPWCDYDPASHRRNCITAFLVGGSPNRQQIPLLFDRRGPHVYMLLLQADLIFIGIYSALVLVLFAPVMFRYYVELHDLAGLLALYVVLAFVPAVHVAYRKKRLVATLTEVCSVGSYRKVHLVSDVIRETKTKSAVRTFIVIAQMKFAAAAHHDDSDGDDRGGGDVSASSLLSVEEYREAQMAATAFDAIALAEVGKTFDTFDIDGSGEIDADELREILDRLSVSTTPEAVNRILAALDADGDGAVQRDEFLNWYKDKVLHGGGGSGGEDGVIHPHQYALRVFDIFDENGNGEITIGEMKDRMDALNVGLTVDDIGVILSELDRDRSGTVSQDEFNEWFEKYYPKELSARPHDPAHSPRRNHGGSSDGRHYH